MNSPYDSRSKVGNVELVFNAHVPKINGISEANGCKVELLSGMKKTQQYMHTSPAERARILESTLVSHAEKMRKNFALPGFSTLGLGSQDEITVCGRVRVERFPGEATQKPGADPRLSEKQGLLLEGSLAHSQGQVVKLDVSKLSNVSLFCGQIIVAQGISSSGTTLIASRIYSGVVPPKPEAIIDLSEQPLTIWAAAGPFTLPSDLDFRPLRDLLNQVESEPITPDVVLLLGPFVPENHPKVKAADIVFQGIEVSFNELFHLKVAQMISQFVTKSGSQTRFLFVPSVADVHHNCVFPQPPFKQSLFTGESGEDLTHGGQVVLLPNPALVRVGSTVIGVGTADLPMHLIRSGDVQRWSAAANKSKRRPHRYERFCDHMLLQQSFYPLHPADASCPLDMTFHKDLALPVQPDLLLLRSSLSLRQDEQ